MKIRPIGDRVVLKKVEAEETTQSGIILTGAAKKAPQFAEVVAVGKPLDSEVAIDLKEGDKVIYSEYAGVDVKLEGQDYIVLKFEDVVGVLED